MAKAYPDGWSVQAVTDGFEAKKWFNDHYKTARGRTEDALSVVIGEIEQFHKLRDLNVDQEKAAYVQSLKAELADLDTDERK